VNLQWYKASLLPGSTDVFTDNFYKDVGTVFCALIPANHRNQRVVVISNPDDPRTVRVITAGLASTFLQPGRRTLVDARQLDAMCEAVGIFNKFLRTGEEAA
jgi:hypothetical protein